MNFTAEEINRYSRQLMADGVGPEGQMKIRAARVLVVGAGGLGCPVLQYLAAAGTGVIGIVDFDVVEIHNLHRQVLYHTADIGQKKAFVAAERLKAVNPNCQVTVFDVKLLPENADGIISRFDLVVDGSDNFPTRYLVNDVCVRLGKPLVYGSVLNFEGQLAVFNYRGSKNLRHFYPDPPDPGTVPSCNENGVLGIIPGVVGGMMCLLAMKIILEQEVETDSLVFTDFAGLLLQKFKG